MDKIKLKKIVQDLGLKAVLRYIFFQKILRINHDVPWPVDPSSRVIYVNNLKVKDMPAYPGYMPGQYIQALNGISIGGNVRMAMGVKIISANHDKVDTHLHIQTDPIQIGDDCWLGASCIILPGVTLGRRVVVGAGSVVTKSFPSDCVIVGNPARIVNQL